MSTSYGLGAKSLSTLDLVTAQTSHANQVIDAAVECSSAALKAVGAAASAELLPVAAGLAYAAIVGGAACATKLTLLASGASAASYDQAAAALEVLSPAGLATVLAGALAGRDLVKYAGYANLGVDARDAIRDILDSGYSLGDLARSKLLPPLAFVGVKAGQSAAGNGDKGSASPTEKSGGDNGRVRPNDRGFVPRSGPGQHAEPF